MAVRAVHQPNSEPMDRFSQMNRPGLFVQNSSSKYAHDERGSQPRIRNVYSAMCFLPLFTLMFSTPFILQACPFFLVLVRRKKKGLGVAETSNKNNADSGEFGKYFHPSRWPIRRFDSPRGSSVYRTLTLSCPAGRDRRVVELGESSNTNKSQSKNDAVRNVLFCLTDGIGADPAVRYESGRP